MIYNSAISKAVEREADRVMEETGHDVLDFLWDTGELAEIDWTEDGYCDLESAISEIEAAADKCIDFFNGII